MGWLALGHFEVVVFRIALASFSAYLIGQIVDILVFNQLRQLARWWIAPVASTVIGGILDSICFFSIAFYRSSDPYLAAHWLEIGMLDYACKLLISGIFCLPLYGILLNQILKKLHRLAVAR